MADPKSYSFRLKEQQKIVQLNEDGSLYSDLGYDDNLMAEPERFQDRGAEPSSINGSEIMFQGIDTRELKNLSVTNAKIKDATIESAKIDTLAADKITAGQIGAQLITLNDGRVKLDGVNSQIAINDGTRDRVVVGLHGGSYGIEVVDSSGDVLYNEDKIKIQYQFSSGVEAPTPVGSYSLGIVRHATATPLNEIISVHFAKPSEFTITDAVLYTKFQDYRDSSNTYRLEDFTIYLNPTKTWTGDDIYRYSGGTTLVSLHDPAANDEVLTTTLTSDDIDDINTGVNVIVGQKQSDGATPLGYANFNLVLTGYLAP